MTDDRFFLDTTFETSSLPIGIYGLSPSSDRKIMNSNRSVISPIGSPVTRSLSPGTSPFISNSFNSSNFRDNNQSNIHEKETYLNFDFILDDDITGDFDKLKISPIPSQRQNNQSQKTNQLPNLSSGPNAPLFKQNSLPTQFVYSLHERNSQPTYKTVLSQTKQRSTPFFNSPGKQDSKTGSNYNIWNNEVKDDYFDLFGGFEMESHTQSKSYDFNSSNLDDSSYTGSTMNQESYSFGNSPSQYDFRRTNSPHNPLTNPNQHFSNSKSSSPHSTRVNQQEQIRNASKPTLAPNYNFKHSSRIISVQNAGLFRDDIILSCFEKYGELRSVNKANNVYLISYYDLRCAQAAMQNLSNVIINDVALELGFHFLREFNNVEESNQGTLVVFNLDQFVSTSDLHTIFGAYGEIREIRESPNKKHKFIEFFDIREADLAMRYLNKTEIHDKKIKIEPSRPGGHRNELINKERNFPQMSSSAPSNHHSYMSQQRQNTPSNTYFDDNLSPRTKNTRVVNTYLNITKSSHSNVGGVNPTSESFDKKQELRDFGEKSNDEHQSKFGLDVVSILNGDDDRTSLMIKNIPNKYNQDMLLTAVNKNHEGLYDFFYLPIDFKNKCNVGYAFINFKSAISIPNFYREFNNKKWEKFNSEKVCQISYARIQGRDSMVEHFKNSSLLFEDPKCQPLIFQNDGSGKEEPCPMGTNIRTKPKKDTGSQKLHTLKK